MSKQYYYHGTSADNLPFILKYGLSTSESKIWSCSADEIYLWCPEKLAIAECQQDEEDDYKQQTAFQRAYESAQIACAASKDCRAVVLKIALNPSEVYRDTSCENMEDSGAVCIGRDILLKEIVSIFVSNDLGLLKGYFINLIKDRDYCNIDFSPLEIQIADIFKTAEIYPETIEEITKWEQISIPKKTKA